MWSNIIFLLVGFGIGCTFKELLGKKDVPNERRQANIPPVSYRPSTTNSSTQSRVNGFSLNSIRDVFDSYHVTLINESSFSALLREIKNQCYKNLLKRFMDNANSPESLVRMLKEESTPRFDVSLHYSNQPPYISDERLNEYVKEANASPSDIGGSGEKVKFLMTLNHARGVENFKNTLGMYLNEILDEYDRGEDISESYLKIMDIIKSRYEYLK